MKTSRFSESQIVAILREAEATEATIGAICHAHGISENTFYRWRKRYGSMEVSEVRRLRRHALAAVGWPNCACGAYCGFSSRVDYPHTCDQSTVAVLPPAGIGVPPNYSQPPPLRAIRDRAFGLQKACKRRSGRRV